MKQTLYQKEWVGRNPTKVQEYADKWRVANPDKVRDGQYRRRYGISTQEYETLLVSQDGRCAICHQPPRTLFRGRIKRLSVDHNHTTEQVRGLLCIKCNSVIDVVEKYPESIQQYLLTTKPIDGKIPK